MNRLSEREQELVRQWIRKENWNGLSQLLLVAHGERPACNVGANAVTASELDDFVELIDEFGLAYTASVEEDRMSGKYRFSVLVAHDRERIKWVRFNSDAVRRGVFYGYADEDIEWFNQLLDTETDVQQGHIWNVWLARYRDRGVFAVSELQYLAFIDHIPVPSESGVSRAIETGQQYESVLRDIADVSGLQMLHEYLDSQLNDHQERIEKCEAEWVEPDDIEQDVPVSLEQEVSQITG